MSTPFYKQKDGELLTFAPNFKVKAALYTAQLGLTPAEIGTISAACDAFVTTSNAQTAADAAKTAATITQLAAKATLLNLVSGYNDSWQLKATVTDTILQDLGLPVHSTIRTQHNPFVPTNLTGLGSSLGINALKWGRNGNVQGVAFIVEVSYDELGEWGYAGTTTKRTFEHTGQVPGRVAYYRVRAEHRGLSSVACDPAVVWGVEAPEAQQLKVA